MCHKCGRCRPEIDERFVGWATVANRAFVPGLPLTAAMRYIPPEQRIPDYGLHGLARVLMCALDKMPGLLTAAQSYPVSLTPLRAHETP